MVNVFAIFSLLVSLLGTSVQVALAAPSLSFNPPSKDFGNQPLGTTGPAQTFIVANSSSSGETLTFSSVAAVNGPGYDIATPAFFAVTGGSCTATSVLTTGQTCTVTAVFQPQALPTTPPDSNSNPAVTGLLEVMTNSGLYSATLAGTITTPTPTYTPGSASFGDVPVGTYAPAQTIVLKNTTGGAVQVTTVAFVGVGAPSTGQFLKPQDSCTGASLAQGDSCTVSVVFGPTTSGYQSDRLQFATNAPVSGNLQDIVVTGTGVVSPLAVGPTGLTFTQPVTTTSAAQTVVLFNDSGATVTLGAPALALAGGGAAQFTIPSTTCVDGATLSNGAFCTVDVRFVAPATVGTSLASVTFSYILPGGGPQAISASLIGNAIAPGAPFASAAPTSSNFGNQQISTVGGTVPVTLTNTGQGNLTFSFVPGTFGGDSAEFGIVADGCGTGTLVPGAFCTVTVRFTPNATPGTKSSTLRFQDNASGSPQLVNLTGTAVAAPAAAAPFASLSTGALNFGTQQVATPSGAQTVTVTNTGTANLTFNVGTFTFIGPDGGDFSPPVANTCVIGGPGLAPGASCDITLRFTPAAAGNRAATLQLATNAGTKTVTLNGAGAAATPLLPGIAFSPAALAYGSRAVGSTTSGIVVVTNTGTASLAITAVAVAGGNSGDFTGLVNGCTVALVSGAQCQVTVSFTPSAVGNRASSLVFTDNAPNGAAGSTQIVPLNGVGTATPAAVLTFNPTSIDFGTIQQSQLSGAQAVTLTNTGNAPLTITSSAVVGGDAGSFAPIATNCVGTLPAGLSCTATLRLIGGTVGNRASTYQIVTNAGTASVTLNGVVSAGPVTAPFASLSTGALDFGPVVLGGTSGVQTVTVTNTGTAPLTFSSLPTTAGADGGQFVLAVNTCAPVGLSLAPGASCDITLRFTPTGSPGPRGATVQIATNAGTHTVTLNGVATATAPPATPQIAFSPAALAFGQQTVGIATSGIVVVTNTGTAILTFGGTPVAVAGGDAANFAVVNGCTATLASGASCQVTVSFTPSAVGNRASSLVFTDNAPNGTAGNTQIVPLSGIGVAAGTPTASVAPASVDFGDQQVGTIGGTVPVTLTNTGTANLIFTVGTFTFVGPNSADFSPPVANTCATGGLGLVPGASCDITLRFSPPLAATPGSRVATLQIASNAGTNTVTLNGVATATPPPPTPAIAFSPAALAFPAQELTTTSGARLVTISNVGGADLFLGAITVSGGNAGEFAIVAGGCSAAAITPGSSCTVGVTFAPTATGNRASSLLVQSNAPNGVAGNTQIVPLSGIGADGGLAINPASLDFGTLTVGSSAIRTVTLTNSGTVPVTFSPTSIGGAGFTIAGNSCGSGTLDPNQSCQIGVLFAPTAASGVPQTGTLTITSTASASPQTVGLVGQATSQVVSFTPIAVDFGPQQLTTTATRGVLITNTSGGPVTVGGISAPGAPFALVANSCGAAPFTMANGASCALTIAFTPTTANFFTTNLTLGLGGGTSASLAISGSGVNAPTPAVEITPASLEFGDVQQGTTSQARTVTIKNTGAGALVIGTVSVTVNAAEFAEATDACQGVTLTQGQSCTVSVTFTPGGTGDFRVGLLTINDNAPTGGSTQLVPLSGVRVTSQLTATPVNLSFGNVQTGSVLALPVTLTNPGGGPVTISAITPAGTGFGLGGGNCVGVLAGGASCQFSATFAAGSGPANGGYQIASSVGTLIVPATGTGVNQQLTASPATLDFGNVQTGSAVTLPVTLTNSGVGGVNIASIASGGGPYVVGVGSCIGGLGAGQSCQFTVTFTPTAGTQNSAIVVSSTAGTLVVPVTGVGVTAQLTATPGALDFGNVQFSSTVAKTVTLKNTGTGPVTINALTPTGTGYAVQANTCVGVLAEGAECQFAVTFTASVGGAIAGTVTIVTSTGALTVPLTAVGVSPQLQVSPPALDFGQQTQGTTTPAQTVTVKNIGSGPITFFSPASISGGFGFLKSSDGCATGTLVAGASCQISVTFTAGTLGATTGSLNLFTGAGLVSVSLSAASISQTAMVQPSALDFGTVTLGTAVPPRAIIITNTGGSPLFISGASAGGNFTEITDDCASKSLGSGGSCTVTVTMDTTGLGNRTGTYTFGTSGGPFTVPLTGMVVSAALDVTPLSVDFGDQAAGTQSAARAVTVRNGGTSPVTIGALGVSAGFTLTTNNCTGRVLGAGESCAVGVIFNSATPGGQKTGTLTIPSNAPSVGSNVLVALSGNTTAPLGPQLSLSDSALNFGPQGVGTSQTRTVTATNTGTAPLVMASAVVANVTLAGFSATGNGCAGVTLNPGESCAIGVTFAPTVVGGSTGTLTFTSNAPVVTSTQVVSLSGTGVSSPLRFTPSPLDFGPVAIGTSATRGVLVTNDGPGTVSIATVGGLLPPFFLDSTTCTGLTLAAGASCQVTVRFQPTTTPGPFSDAIDVTLVGGVIVSSAVTGFAVAAPTPAVTILPGSLNFGFVQTGTTSPARTATITNTGNADLIIGAVTVSLGGAVFVEYADGCQGTTLKPGQFCTVSVVFTPTATGFQTGTLTINDNAGTPSQTVSLTGAGVSPAFGLSPTGLSFGPQQLGTTSAPQTITLTNSSGGPLTIGAVSIVGGAHFLKGADTCANQTIAANASCDIAVSFKPTAGGPLNDTLSIIYTGVAGPVTIGVNLSGVGVSATLALTPSALNFGQQQIGTTATQSVLVTNTGAGPVTLTGFVFGGGSNAAFTFTGTTCASGVTLAAGASCVVGINFLPTVLAPVTGSVVITSNAGGSPTTIQLSGSGSAQPTPVVGLAPASLDFGYVQVGSSSVARTVTITNNGDAALAITGATITGSTDFTKFADTCTLLTINPGQSCTVSVVFKPTVTGPLAGVLTLTDNAPSGGSTQTISLTGIGVSPAFTLSANGLDFGDQQLGTTGATQTITLTNSTGGPLTLGAITLAGSQFVKTGDTCAGNTIAAGQRCQIGIVFAPTAAGQQSGTLGITYAGATGPVTIGVTLTGVGISPTVTVTPQTLDFGSIQVGTTSAALPITFRNVGAGPITITSAVSSGGDFTEVTDDCAGKTLGNGDACTMSVRFQPTAAGNAVGTYTIATTGGTFAVLLTGVGVTGAPGVGPASLAFGDQQVGTASPAQTVTVTNNGLASLTLTATTLSGGGGSQYELFANACQPSGNDVTLAPGQSCTLGVRFHPTATGIHNETLRIATDAQGVAGSLTVALTGIGTAPAMRIAPASLDFGNVQVGSVSAARTVTVTNTGVGPLSLTGLTLTGASAGEYQIVDDNCTTAAIAPGGSCTIGVRFRPTVTGPKQAELALTSSAVPTPQTVGLSGAGISAGFTLTPAALDLGTVQVGATSVLKTLTLTNTSGGPLTIGAVGILGAASEFATSGDTCATKTIADGGTCAIGIIFKPTVTGTRNDTLRIAYSNGAATVTLDVSLTGIGVTSALRIAPSAIAFGDQLLGTTSQPTTITITNTGLGSLTITGMTPGGPNASDFLVSGNACPTATIPAGASCTFAVSFRPTASGLRNATLTVADNAGGSPQTIIFSGTGTVPPGPAVVLNVPSVTFGNQQLFTTSGTQTVTVTNGGGTALDITSVTPTGTNAGDFILTGNTCSNQQLAPGVSCTFGVAFRPTAVGARQAEITLVTSAGTVTLLLSGTGVTPAVGLSAASLDFGPQPLNTQSAAQTLTLTNNGTSSLAISAIVLGGDNAGDFILGANTCLAASLVPGGKCAFGIAFKPTATGARTATVTITDNAAGSPRTVLLTGQGTTTAVGLSSSNLQFGNQALGTTSAAQTLTITNTGSTSVTIASVVPGGADAADFILSGGACTGATLAAGATCAFGVTFRPTAVGARAAILTITDTAAGSPRTVILGGTGITGGLRLSAGSLTFGVQPVGAQSETQLLTITNDGTTAVTISGTTLLGTGAADFALYANGCGGATLQAGGTCQIGVAFKPTTVGNRAASLSIADTAPGSPHTVALTGIGVTAGIGFSVGELDFGPVQLGASSSSKSVTLTNNSGGAVAFTVAVGGMFQGDYLKGLDTCNNVTIGPGATCSINVRFTPLAAGSRPAALGVTVVGASTYALGLNGSGVTGLTIFTPSSLDFGTQPLTTQSGFRTITVSNGGGGPLTISAVGKTGAGAADFIINNGNACVATLAPLGTCTITVAFAPTVAGSRSAEVAFTTNVGGGTQTVALHGDGGTAPAPVVAVNPTGLTFVPQQVGTQSGIQTVTVSNTGTANLVLGAVTITGTNAGDFTKGNDACSGATVTPGNTCTIAVRFTPTAGGSRVGALSFGTNTASGTQTASLVGIGTTPGVHLDVSSLNFGSVQVGTTATTRTVTLTNSGTGELNISAVTVVGLNMGDFAKVADTCNSAFLAPGGTCQIGISFTPGATGARVGSLRLTDNAPGSPHTLPLNGEGTAVPSPAIQLSATTLSFGPVQVGATGPGQTLTVTNGGGGTLTVLNVTVSAGNAGDFLKSGDTCSGVTLGTLPGDVKSCTIGMLFKPGAAGARQSSLLVIHSASGSAQTVVLSGVGVTGAVGLGAASLQFGTQTVGTQSAAQTLTVTNSGLGILTLGPVTVGGAAAGDWTLLANTCAGATIDAGKTCQIGVAFKPTAEGDRGATLELVNTAAGSTHVVALNGLGGPVAPYYNGAVIVPGAGGGAVLTPAPGTNGKYPAGTVLTLRATAQPNYIFIGWILNGQKVGWANPLTVTVMGDVNAEAQFAPRPNFDDTAGSPYLTAIRELSGRGIIRGYGDGNFGPSDFILRAQMAALIARAMEWDLEDHGNKFSDRNGVDANLWRNVGTLAFYGVARGYRDDTYDPTGRVLHAQTISFITRAMVAKGFWETQDDNGAIYPNVPADSGHRQDIVTYVFYVGALPGTSSANSSFTNWNQATPREWFAESLWRALNSYSGVDRVP